MMHALEYRNALESKYGDVMRVTYTNINVGKIADVEVYVKNHLDKEKDKILIEALTIHAKKEAEAA